VCVCVCVCAARAAAGVDTAWHDFNDSRVSKLGRTVPDEARRCAALALGDKPAGAEPSSAKSIVEHELQSMTADDRATTAALRALCATMRGSESAYVPAIADMIIPFDLFARSLLCSLVTRSFACADTCCCIDDARCRR
jgi:hypothetical protein